MDAETLCEVHDHHHMIAGKLRHGVFRNERAPVEVDDEMQRAGVTGACHCRRRKSIASLNRPCACFPATGI